MALVFSCEPQIAEKMLNELAEDRTKMAAVGILVLEAAHKTCFPSKVIDMIVVVVPSAYDVS